MMPRPTTLLLALATLSATTVLHAQSPDPAGQPTIQSQPAPIERPHAYAPRPGAVAATLTVAQPLVTTVAVATAQPTQGVFLRVAPNSSVTAATIDVDTTELRVDRGLVNISVHHPANGPAILVDLPGGQTSLLKDGLYTFNAASNTVRVLKGEAIAYPPNQKRIKVKEDHAVVLAGNARSTEFDPMQARADLIPFYPRPDGPNYARGGGYGYPGYGFGPYGDGFYGGGYGYGYGYPYGFYDYPFGFGLGFGYYGGFGYGGFGGYRGGYGGGFRGHR